MCIRDRQRAAFAQFSQQRRHVSGVAHRRIVHGAIDMPVEAVRHHRLLSRARPRREDAQIGIDLHGIGVDDGSAGAACDLDRERGLAARGRTCDEHRADLPCRLHPVPHMLVATLVSAHGQALVGEALLARLARTVPGITGTTVLDGAVAALSLIHI